MSLIVLNSHGQDPAEFENHFGRGLKLPRNAEICLCGVNLNRYNKHDEAVVIQDNNDAFIVLVSGGSANPQDYAPFGAYAVKLKPGSFTFGDVASQLSNALAVGNYLYGTKNYMNIPVSPLRMGLRRSAPLSFFNANSIPVALVSTVRMLAIACRTIMRLTASRSTFVTFSFESPCFG